MLSAIPGHRNTRLAHLGPGAFCDPPVCPPRLRVARAPGPCLPAGRRVAKRLGGRGRNPRGHALRGDQVRVEPVNGARRCRTTCSRSPKAAAAGICPAACGQGKGHRVSARAPGFESGSAAARLAALGITLPKAAAPLAAAGG